MNNHKKLIKNYCILIVLFLAVILAYYFIIRIYRVNKITQSSVLVGKIPVISLADFDNYIIEDPDVIIYMPTLEEDNYEFEVDLLELIIDNRWEENLIYLDIKNSNYSKTKQFIFTSYADYILEDQDEKAVLLILQNGKINDSLLINDKNNFEEVELFLKNGNEVLSDD